jgi:ribokinase
VGEDAFGEFLRNGLGELGVDTGGVVSTPGPSGVAVITVDERGENTIIINPGANDQMDTSDLGRLESALKSAGSLLMQLEIPLEAVTTAAVLARKHAVRVILDPAPASPLPDELYGMIDILTPNETECALLVGFEVKDPPLAEKAAGIFIERGVKQVIIKLGARGAYLHDGKTGELVPGFSVEAVDTTAAGDAFNGALATALDAGQDLRAAVRFANAVGALSTMKHGAQPSMPTAGEVDRFLKGHG